MTKDTGAIKEWLNSELQKTLDESNTSRVLQMPSEQHIINAKLKLIRAQLAFIDAPDMESNEVRLGEIHSSKIKDTILLLQMMVPCSSRDNTIKKLQEILEAEKTKEVYYDDHNNILIITDYGSDIGRYFGNREDFGYFGRTKQKHVTKFIKKKVEK